MILLEQKPKNLASFIPYSIYDNNFMSVHTLYQKN